MILFFLLAALLGIVFAVAAAPREAIDINRLQSDPTYFALVIWNKELQPKQVEFATACIEEDHVVACFSRQTGKSFLLSVMCIFYLLWGPPGQIKIGVYAPRFETAIDIMFNNTKELIYKRWDLFENEVAHIKMGRITMRNGNELRAFTANKNANVRGYSPSIILIDESQDITDKMYFQQILPSGSAMKGLTADIKEGFKTKIWEAGTPGGRNHFHDSLVPLNLLHRIDSYDSDLGNRVVTQTCEESWLLGPDYIEKMRRRMMPEEFAQEYMITFNLDTGFVFPWDHILLATAGNTERNFIRQATRRYYGGVDLGRNKDHTVLSIFEYFDGQYDMVCHKQWDLGLTWMQIFEEMLPMIKAWEPTLLLWDVGQVGDMAGEIFFSQLKNCEPFTFGNESKRDLVVNGQKLFANEKINMWDIDSLRKEFDQLEEGRTQTGKPTYMAPDRRDGKGKMHDDQVFAVLLALMAGRFHMGEQDGMESMVDNEVSELQKFMDKQIPKGDDRKESRTSERVGERRGKKKNQLRSIFNDKRFWDR